MEKPSRKSSTEDDNPVPSIAALALATRITPEQYKDIYQFAMEIDLAFQRALGEAVEEERQRIFRMPFTEVMREFWRGRKLRKNHLEAEVLQ